MYFFDHQVRVRYGDTDQMGYVYYGNYAYYYEQARSEAIRALGFPYKQLEASGVMMPITRMQSRFRQPAFYDDLLTVRVFIPELPGRMILFTYEIRNEKNELIHEGETQLAFISLETRRPTHAPPKLINLLRPFFQ